MNFLLGGRTGDLIHALYVVKNTPGKHNLFITDRRDLHSDGFLLPLGETIEELRPILMQQDYIHSFQEYNNEECTNLSMWRRHAYSTHWAQLLSSTFGCPVSSAPWIKLSEKHPDFKGKTVIHCSVYEARRGYHWDKVNLKDCVFVGVYPEYAISGLNIPFYPVKSLLEFFTIINSCDFFIGNQSSPLAMAHSMGVPRLAILNEVDKLHYTGEESVYNNFWWLAKEANYLSGIKENVLLSS